MPSRLCAGLCFEAAAERGVEKLVRAERAVRHTHGGCVPCENRTTPAPHACIRPALAERLVCAHDRAGLTTASQRASRRRGDRPPRPCWRPTTTSRRRVVPRGRRDAAGDRRPMVGSLRRRRVLRVGGAAGDEPRRAGGTTVLGALAAAGGLDRARGAAERGPRASRAPHAALGRFVISLYVCVW